MAAKYQGYWVPRSRYDLSARRTHGPSGISSSARAQRRDSLSNPLLGFDSPTRLVPMSSPKASQPKAPLLGFLFPYSARVERESTSCRCYPVRLPGFTGNLSASPTLPTTVPLAGFLNLSAAFFLSPTSCHFQTGGAHGVCPTGTYSFREAPDAHRRRYALLTFLPQFGQSPFLGGNHRRRTHRLPRMLRRGAFHRLQGLRLRGNRSASQSHD